jgi:uncharacterized protein YceK
MKKIAILTITVILSGCSTSRVDDIKQHAEEVWNKNGFKVIGYEGYQWGSFDSWGGKVWYIVEKDNTIFHGALTKWGDEYHTYNLSAINAIKAN